MTMRRAILFCAFVSILAGGPYAFFFQPTIALLDPKVRTAAPRALQQLRSEGMWLVNAELTHIDHESVLTCFTWLYGYQSRTHHASPDEITLCL